MEGLMSKCAPHWMQSRSYIKCRTFGVHLNVYTNMDCHSSALHCFQWDAALIVVLLKVNILSYSFELEKSFFCPASSSPISDNLTATLHPQFLECCFSSAQDAQYTVGNVVPWCLTVIRVPVDYILQEAHRAFQRISKAWSRVAEIERNSSFILPNHLSPIRAPAIAAIRYHHSRLNWVGLGMNDRLGEWLGWLGHMEGWGDLRKLKVLPRTLLETP